MAKKLNLKPTNNLELAEKWGLNYNPSLKGKLYIRCNAKGAVNWEKAPVYNHLELIGRENVNIITNP